MSHISVATIKNPEFIDLQPLDINPLMSECKIKVLYVGENRNQSYISKEVATEMAKTLRGAPIVGYYSEEKEDFRDHGEQIIIDGDGIKFDVLTKPYGFVSPNAEVWFQEFEDKDDFGNSILREYLMTTGYLWTGQYEEAKLAIDEGRPHSMELDSESIEGHWAENFKNGVEFFIINDAVFSKLCILGEDVEPCFEGSSIEGGSAPTSYTLDKNFTQTLYSMMEDLKKFVLQGGEPMTEEIKTPEVAEVVAESTEQQDFSLETEGQIVETVVEENQDTTEGQTLEDTSYAKDDDKEDKAEEEKKEESEKDEKYALLQQQYDELNSKFTALQADYDALVEYKNQVEGEKKDALIQKFYMLSDEDKKDVCDNKSKYSLDEIESKLSVIYAKKQLAADAAQDNSDNNKTITTFNLVDQDAGIPDWVKAVRDVQENL